MSLWTLVCSVLLCKSVRKNTLRHSYKTSNKGQCEAYIHSIGVSRWLRPSLLGRGRGRGQLGPGDVLLRWSLPSPFGEGLGGEAKRASSTFENMPFLHAEDALLEARRASSTTLFVMGWFIECYECDKRRWYVLILQTLTSIVCNDFLRCYWLSWTVETLPIFLMWRCW